MWLPHAVGALLVAYTNRSILGSLFLASFLTWGWRYRSQTSHAAVQLRGLLGLTLSYLLLLLLVLLLVAGGYLDGLQGRTLAWLELAGLLPAPTDTDTTFELQMALLPPVILLLLIHPRFKQLMQQYWGQQQQQQQQEPCSDSISSSSSSSVIFPCSIVAAAIAWPCMATLPYVIVLAGALHAWSLGHNAYAGYQSAIGSSAHDATLGGALSWRRGLQLYAAVHISLQYLFQVRVLHDISVFASLAQVLGLYSMSSSAPIIILAPQLIHLVSLHALFVALGLQRGSPGSSTSTDTPRVSNTLSGTPARGPDGRRPTDTPQGGCTPQGRRTPHGTGGLTSTPACCPEGSISTDTPQGRSAPHGSRGPAGTPASGPHGSSTSADAHASLPTAPAGTVPVSGSDGGSQTNAPVSGPHERDISTSGLASFPTVPADRPLTGRLHLEGGAVVSCNVVGGAVVHSNVVGGAEVHSTTGSNVVGGAVVPVTDLATAELGAVLPSRLAGMTAWLLAVLSTPAMSTLGLCCAALIKVTVLSGGLLAVGLLLLLLPSSCGRGCYARYSSILINFLCCWFLACYIATCIQESVTVPDLLQSLGLMVFDEPPPLWLRLGVMLAAIIPTAALSRATAATTYTALSRTTAIIPTAALSRAAVTTTDPALSRATAATTGPVVSRTMATTTAVVSHAVATSAEPATAPEVLTEVQPQARMGGQGSESAHASDAWRYMAATLVPASCLLLSVSRLDALHSVYIALLLAVLVPCQSIHPRSSFGCMGCPLACVPPFLLTCYASMHLLLMYACLCCQLPGLPLIDLHAWEQPMLWLGLTDLSLLRDCAPVLVALMITTVLASPDSLTAQRFRTHTSGTDTDTDTGTGSSGAGYRETYPTALDAVLASLGHLIIPAMGISLLLCNAISPPGVIGVVYLMLLSCVMLQSTTVTVATTTTAALPFTSEQQPPARDTLPSSAAAAAAYVGDQLPASDPSSTSVSCRSPCGWGRWVLPCTLSLMCCFDMAMQYGSTVFLTVSPGVLTQDALMWLQIVLGEELGTSQGDLLLHLLRPVLLLGAFSAYRSSADLNPEGDGAIDVPGRPFSEGLLHMFALSSRAIAVHAETAIVLLLFAASLIQPGALGLASIVVLAVLLTWTWYTPAAAYAEGGVGGSSRGGSSRGMRGMGYGKVCSTAMRLALMLLLIVWMAADYCLRVPSIRDWLRGGQSARPEHPASWQLLHGPCQDLTSAVEAVLEWMGLMRRGGSAHSNASLPGGGSAGPDEMPLASVLGFKLALLLVVATKSTVLWRPEADISNSQTAVLPSCRRTPPSHASSSEELRVSSSHPTGGASVCLRAESDRRGVSHVLLAMYGGLLRVVDVAESAMSQQDACLFLLLLSAFLLANGASLLCMTLAVVGMVVVPEDNRWFRAWSKTVTPTVALLLLHHYAAWAGGWTMLLDPLFSCRAKGGADEGMDVWPGSGLSQGRKHDGSDDSDGAAWSQWLGLEGVYVSALWALFFCFLSAALQRRSLSSSYEEADTDDVMMPDDIETPLLPRDHFQQQQRPQQQQQQLQQQQQQQQQRQRQQRQRQERQNFGDLPWASGCGGVSPRSQQAPTPRSPSLGLGRVIRPLDVRRKRQWSALDWIQFVSIKHSMDVLLVCVLVACTIQRDIVHAGYLAMALLLFRKRSTLRSSCYVAANASSDERAGEGGLALFWLLPAFNVLVMAAELVYQAPWQILLGPGWNLLCMQQLDPGSSSSGGADDPSAAGPSVCSWSQLLGFCKLHPSGASHPVLPKGGGGGDAADSSGYGAVLFLMHSPSLADLLLWVILRLHAKLRSSEVFKEVMALAADQDRAAVAEVQSYRQNFVETEAHKALRASQQKAARIRRIEKLKAIFLGPHGIGVSGLAEVLDNADQPFDRVFSDEAERKDCHSALIDVSEVALVLRSPRHSEGGSQRRAHRHSDDHSQRRPHRHSNDHNQPRVADRGGSTTLGEAATRGAAHGSSDHLTEPTTTGMDPCLTEPTAEGSSQAAVPLAGSSIGEPSASGLNTRVYGGVGGGRSGGGSGGGGGDPSGCGLNTNVHGGGGVDGSSGGSGGGGCSGGDETSGGGLNTIVCGGTDVHGGGIYGGSGGGVSGGGGSGCGGGGDGGGGGSCAGSNSSQGVYVGPSDPRLHPSRVLARSSSLSNLGASVGICGHRAMPLSIGKDGMPHSSSAPTLRSAWHEGRDAASQAVRALDRGEGLGAARAGRSMRMSRSSLLLMLFETVPSFLLRVGNSVREQLIRRDDDSYLVYASLMLLLVCDMSAMALLPVLSMFLYSVLSNSKPRAYWHGLLVYLEAALTAQYSFQVFVHCLCGRSGSGGGAAPLRMHRHLFDHPASLADGHGDSASCAGLLADPSIMAGLTSLGLHQSAFKDLPLFLSYLALLMHTYYLAQVSPTQRRTAEAEDEGVLVPIMQPRAWLSPHRISGFTGRMRKAVVGAANGVIGVFRRVTQSHELPPHWIKVWLQFTDSATASQLTSGERRAQIERSLQLCLDFAYRLGDEPRAVALSEAGRQRSQLVEVEEGGRRDVTTADAPSYFSPLVLELNHIVPTADRAGAIVLLKVEVSSTSGGRSPLEPARTAAVALRLLAATSSDQQHRTAGASSDHRKAGASDQQHRKAGASSDHRTAGASSDHCKAGASDQQHRKAGASSDHRKAGASDQQHRKAGASSDRRKAGAAAAKHRSSSNSSNQRIDDSSSDDRAAASDGSSSNTHGGVRQRRGVSTTQLPESPPPPGASPTPLLSLPFELQEVEYHSRTPRDFYTATALVSVLAFLYMALFYQAVVGSLRGIADSGEYSTPTLPMDGEVLPTDYLAVLMMLFVMMVTERAVYILGSHAGKAVLHCVSVLIIIPGLVLLNWHPDISRVAQMHLRLMLLFQCASAVLGAAQLRCGYPPLSTYGRMGGRHMLVFHRRADIAHSIAFNIFMAIPFLYELRELLDWTCTTTTLDLYDWLKLQDIRNSLFIATVRHQKGDRRTGDKVPPYMKFLSGFMALVLLFLVLWLPLIAFSSGAPTFQIPTLTNVRLNVSIHQSLRVGDVEAVSTFQVYQSGGQHHTQNWARAGTTSSQSADGLPIGLSNFYSVEQVKLMCLAQDSQQLWAVTPPGRDALAASLDSDGASFHFTWSFMRSAPPPTQRGGPTCLTVIEVPLSGVTRMQMQRVLNGTATGALLMARNASDPDGPGSLSLFPRFLRLSGELCNVRVGFQDSGSGSAGRTAGRRNHEVTGWRGGRGIAARGVTAGSADGAQRGAPLVQPLQGNARPSTSPPPSPPPPLANGSSADDWAEQGVSCTLSLEPNEEVEAGPAALLLQWWRLSCNAIGLDEQVIRDDDGHAACDDGGMEGPQAVVVLEMVQAGFLGATLSSFGITGLYLTFVLGIGRFLRLSILNLRLRIPTEDLPSTRRLVTLYQDICIARAQQELVLEEELFGVLINAYRSPQVLFELSRKKPP